MGSTVLLAILGLDRGRCEFPNLKAVVLEVSAGGMYKLGCKTGVLDSLYSRNQFSPTLEKFLIVAVVPTENILSHALILSLRAAAKEESMGSGQGFFKCSCTGNCITKRCKCLKAARKCNSRCHNRRSCKNVD